MTKLHSLLAASSIAALATAALMSTATAGPPPKVGLGCAVKASDVGTRLTITNTSPKVVPAGKTVYWNMIGVKNGTGNEALGAALVPHSSVTMWGPDGAPGSSKCSAWYLS